MSALDAGQLNLIEATSFVEFEGDDEAQAELIKVAGTDQFAHRVAQLRADREERARYAEAAADYAAKGYTVLEQRPGWYDKTHIPAHNLKDGSGASLTDEAIAAMQPRHWAVWLETAEVYLDAETGAVVDEDGIDFGTEDNPDLEPDEGLRHFRTVTRARSSSRSTSASTWPAPVSPCRIGWPANTASTSISSPTPTTPREPSSGSGPARSRRSGNAPSDASSSP
ncbi:MAG: hypothetical protein SV966_10890 [Actinomycetota bacterium]|nr:hypothetical protein [Actinomycetota bacterium]